MPVTLLTVSRAACPRSNERTSPIISTASSNIPDLLEDGSAADDEVLESGSVEDVEASGVDP